MTINAPKCKLCGFQHWLNQPHVYAKRINSVEDVQQVARRASSQAAGITSTRSPAVVPAAPSPTVTKMRGRPKRYENAAAKQKAYRQRVKA